MLEARQVGFAYGPREVLHGVDLSLAKGEVVGLVGPNGCGKTTLLKCLAGVLPARGEVRYDGVPLAELTPRDRAEWRSYLAQRIAGAFPFTAERMIAQGLAHRSRWFASPAAVPARELLAELACDIEPERPFDHLSGGEQQLVLLARALVSGAPLLLLDEPTSALDLRHQAALTRASRRRTEDGAAVLLSLHDLNLAGVACDRLLLMAHGRVVHRGTPAEVLRRETLQEVYDVTLACGPHPLTGAPAIGLELP